MNNRKYKKKFKNYIISYCKSYNQSMYDSKDLKWFKELAKNEYDAVFESGDFDLDTPELNAAECISYWE